MNWRILLCWIVWFFALYRKNSNKIRIVINFDFSLICLLYINYNKNDTGIWLSKKSNFSHYIEETRFRKKSKNLVLPHKITLSIAFLIPINYYFLGIKTPVGVLKTEKHFKAAEIPYTWSFHTPTPKFYLIVHLIVETPIFCMLQPSCDSNFEYPIFQK